jgi:hypothetical protein
MLSSFLLDTFAVSSQLNGGVANQGISFGQQRAEQLFHLLLPLHSKKVGTSVTSSSQLELEEEPSW